MNPRTRVKICGITRPDDGIEAARLGVDAIGLVFYEKSPRNVTVEQAKTICDALPGFVTVVSLFLNAQKDQIEQVLDEVPIDLIQFHGTETAEFCGSFSRPYIKALGVAGAQNLEDQMQQYHHAKGVLLDSHATGEAGGTGETFDWESVPAGLTRSIILAGGLKPDNVAQAIEQVRPFGVDLSSGVETKPGIKDAALMAQLMKEVKRVDCEHD